MEENLHPTAGTENPLKPDTEKLLEKESSCQESCCNKNRKCWYKLKRDHKIALFVLVILLGIAAANHYKGLFVAATVDGKFITRLQVIRDLEARSGREALESLVTTQVIHDAALRQSIVISEAALDEEIAKIRTRIEKQGTSLEQVLTDEGLSLQSLREQISSQKELEALLGEKIAITDEEVTQYLAENKYPAPTEMSEEEFKTAIRDQLKSQKLGQEASTWIEAAKAKASIQYLAPYSLSLNTPAAVDESTK